MFKHICGKILGDMHFFFKFYLVCWGGGGHVFFTVPI